jgi:ketol-acid reductoisomerase
MHELKLIVDLLHEGGLKKMHEFISDTAAYGDLVSGPRVIDEHVRNNMKEVLKDIQNGRFADKWIKENNQGQEEYKKLMEDDLNHPIEKVGANLRGKMDWLEN